MRCPSHLDVEVIPYLPRLATESYQHVSHDRQLCSDERVKGPNYPRSPGFTEERGRQAEGARTATRHGGQAAMRDELAAFHKTLIWVDADQGRSKIGPSRLAKMRMRSPLRRRCSSTGKQAPPSRGPSHGAVS